MIGVGVGIWAGGRAGPRSFASIAHRRTVGVIATSMADATVGIHGTDYLPDDLAIITAMRNHNSGAITPGTPTGGNYLGTTALNGDSLDFTSVSGSPVASVRVMRVAGGPINPGTWTNATRLFISFYSGAEGIAEAKWSEEPSGASAATVEGPALDFADGIPSWVYGIFGSIGNPTILTPDARLTTRLHRPQGSDVQPSEISDSNGAVTSWAAGAGSQTATTTNRYVLGRLRVIPKLV